MWNRVVSNSREPLASLEGGNCCLVVITISVESNGVDFESCLEFRFWSTCVSSLEGLMKLSNLFIQVFMGVLYQMIFEVPVMDLDSLQNGRCFLDFLQL